MALHLIKLCVGCDSVDDLDQWIRTRLKQRRKRGLSREHMHRTRMVPKRADELRSGGSLYWVIRGRILCRQPIVDVRPFVDKAGVSCCHLVLDPKLVLVEPRPWRAFQGWRYLTAQEAPRDLDRVAPGAKNMPETLRRELAGARAVVRRELPMVGKRMMASACFLAGLTAGHAAAQDVVKIGMSFAMTGAGFNAAGRQAAAGARLYVQQHGDNVAGKKIELILRDDAGVADNARRIVQEMIVNDKVNILAGGITPTVLAYGALATQARIATVVMISGASVTTTVSPYYVRTSFILSQSSWIMGAWAARNGSKRVVTLVNEWAPGIEAETAFNQRFTELGGEIIESIRIPLANPDFAPFLQRIRDLNPDTAFLYFPGTQAAIFAKQFAERGLANSGIKIIGPGDLTDDDVLNTMGDQMIGMITAHDYSAAHDSPLNRKYVEEFKQANDFQPDFVSVGGYDGMHLIYEALKKTDGRTDGDTLLAAMKGMRWESPRGMMSIDPDTRDIIQNIYISKVEKVNGELWNVEFASFPDVKDPMKVK